jgi:hypothetical protein
LPPFLSYFLLSIRTWYYLIRYRHSLLCLQIRFHRTSLEYSFSFRVSAIVSCHCLFNCIICCCLALWCLTAVCPPIFRRESLFNSSGFCCLAFVQSCVSASWCFIFTCLILYCLSLSLVSLLFTRASTSAVRSLSVPPVSASFWL